MNEAKIIVVGLIKEYPYEHTREANQAVYDVGGVSPTVLATWGVKSSPAKILVKDERDTDTNKY